MKKRGIRDALSEMGKEERSEAWRVGHSAGDVAVLFLSSKFAAFLDEPRQQLLLLRDTPLQCLEQGQVLLVHLDLFFKTADRGIKVSESRVRRRGRRQSQAPRDRQLVG